MARRLSFLLVLALFLTMGSALTATAQVEALPVVGDDVIFPFEGGEMLLAVDEVIDPVDDFDLDPGFSLARDERAIAAIIYLENDAGDITLDPFWFLAVDTDGNIYEPLDEPVLSEDFDPFEAFELEDVADGDAFELTIAFVIPADVAIQTLYFAPSDDRLVLLAVLDADTPAVSRVETPEPEPEPTAPATGPSRRSTPTPATGPGADVDCAAFASYYEETVERFTILNVDIAGDLEAMVAMVESDPFGAAEDLRLASERIQELADEQADAVVPAGLEDLNDDLIMVLDGYAEGFGMFADGLETLNTRILAEAEAIFNELEPVEVERLTELEDLASDCGLQ